MDNYPYSDLDFTEIIGNPEIRETPDGMYAAARCYLNGKGVESNRNAYLDYLEQAASIGSQRAKEEIEEIEEKKQQGEELEENSLDEEDVEVSFEEMLNEAFGDNLDGNSDFPVNESPMLEYSSSKVEDSSASAYFSRYITVTEGLTAAKEMSTFDLYKEAENDNPYACLELYYRTKKGKDRNQVLATQCLEKAAIIAEQEGNPEFCRIVFKEVGEYYIHEDLAKSIDYFGRASELGDSSASLLLARHYLSGNKKDRDQALRYLNLAGTGETDEDTYEIASAYLECGDQLKGKNLLGQLLKKENVNQNLWFRCAKICPEFTTPEEIVHHAWTVKDFNPDVQTYLLNYYEKNPDSADLNQKRIFLLAKWEYDINGTSGPWMQRAANLGVAEAADILDAERLAKEKEAKIKEEALLREQNKKREREEQKKKQEEEKRVRQEEERRRREEEERRRQEEERIRQEEKRIRREEEKRRRQEEEEKQRENDRRNKIIAIIAAIIIILFISHPKIFVFLLIVLVIIFFVWRHNQH